VGNREGVTDSARRGWNHRSPAELIDLSSKTMGEQAGRIHRGMREREDVKGRKKVYEGEKHWTEGNSDERGDGH